jgi:hypothetical protein
MLAHQLKPHVIIQGPLFPEPVQVIVATPLGAAVKLVGKGLRTSQVYEPIDQYPRRPRAAEAI